MRYKTTIEIGERLVSNPYSKYAINTAIRNISKDKNWNIELLPIDISVVREIFVDNRIYNRYIRRLIVQCYINVIELQI